MTDAVLAVRLSAEIKEQVEKWAREEDRSISNFVRRLIEAERARRASAAAQSKNRESTAA